MCGEGGDPDIVVLDEGDLFPISRERKAGDALKARERLGLWICG